MNEEDIETGETVWKLMKPLNVKKITSHLFPVSKSDVQSLLLDGRLEHA